MTDIITSLASASSLTSRQIDVLRSYVRVAKGELSLKEAAALSSKGRSRGRLGQPLTVGSYYRTASQARKNIKESILCLFVAKSIGLVDYGDVSRLLELAESRLWELSDQESDRLANLIDALLERIVL